VKLSVDVHNFLHNEQIMHEIFLTPQPVKTAKRASAILGLNPSEIAKSVIILVDESPVNAIVPGNKNVSIRKLKNLFSDSKVKLADARQAVDCTGYVIGATPPVAHAGSVKTIIDHNCMGANVLYTGGGELNAILKIRPNDLKIATGALEADICE
jgi:Cys-tRNA(Pro) deacylase